MKKQAIALNVANLDERIVPAANLGQHAAAFAPIAVMDRIEVDAPHADAIFVGLGDASANPHTASVDFHNALSKNAVYVGQAGENLEGGIFGGIVDIARKVIPFIPGPKDPLSNIHNNFVNLKSLQVGDILLFQSNGFMSGTTKLFTNGYYNHAAMYVGDGMIVHAIPGGVKMEKLSDYVSRDSGLQRIMTIRVPNLSDFERGKMRTFLMDQVGKRYNYDGALRVTMNDTPGMAIYNWATDGSPVRNDYYCSQLVAAAFKHIGRPVGKSMEQSPGDLSELVKDGKANGVGCLFQAGRHSLS
ncbi:YiiX/YebB-like N1pC/P60 family cysteine hydrolase [Tuwongella immobilis]|uniref:Uncharacterized protein n=1 Tax=Tuwongella immobilis TaxID=692036 RepID=A0A6C2YRN7_9BACT|nr:YiiX/YebB-like N1pC/P60 family cysteine hydrolase [Tuwongella immobilis]VIP04021.1 Uncharacterized protein OS=Cellvibrio sp. BR GN=O59_002642 PE=4 SV=1: DUF830 [Tuwongella immobilis]VTS05409.1 Uncharacterized protein OS=Cellvibrio sp. BR GN=O59_002642 PE=4 SV=1: DUF830 [Tuwongella immobilis]